MESNQGDWKSAEIELSSGPSAEFIIAVAEFLETDAEDMLAELGYVLPDERLVAPAA